MKCYGAGRSISTIKKKGMAKVRRVEVQAKQKSACMENEIGKQKAEWPQTEDEGTRLETQKEQQVCVVGESLLRTSSGTHTRHNQVEGKVVQIQH